MLLGQVGATRTVLVSVGLYMCYPDRACATRTGANGRESTRMDANRRSSVYWRQALWIGVDEHPLASISANERRYVWLLAPGYPGPDHGGGCPGCGGLHTTRL